MDINFSDLTSLYLGGQEVQELYLNGELVWQNAVPAFTIKTRSANNTISTVAQGSPDQQSLEYSTDDGSSWSDFTLGSTSVTLSNIGDTLQIRAKTSNGTIAKTWQNYWKIAATEDFDVEGSMNSLLRNDPKTDATSLTGAFFGLFDGNTHLIDASKLVLPWTDISTSTSASKFEAMFRNCTSLITAPQLPATTIDSYCYKEMFKGCTSLTTAPQLQAMSVPQEAYRGMFMGCTALTVAPALPATVLTTQENYKEMFKGCTSLTTPPPALPATSVPQNGYREMFMNCSNLTTPPALPATSIGQSAYHDMFKNSGITSVPNSLPATTISYEAYRGMFYNCKNLTDASNLVFGATSVEYNGMAWMFGECSNLTAIPTLPSTNLGTFSFQRMFENCTSLTSVDVSNIQSLTMTSTIYGQTDYMFNGCTGLLSADMSGLQSAGGVYHTYEGCSSLVELDLSNLETLDVGDTNQALERMCYGCSSLKTVKLNKLSYTRAAASGTWNDTFNGCSSLETIDMSEAVAVPKLVGSNTFTNTNNTFKIVVPDALYDTWIAATNWSDPSVQPHIVKLSDYVPALKFTANQANSTIAMQAVGSAPSVSLEYSTDGSTWNTFTVGSTTITLANVGDYVFLKAGSNGNTHFGSSTSNYNKFVMTGEIEASNSIMYLLDRDGNDNATMNDNCFCNLFNGCTALTKAPALPSTSLAKSCYNGMFRGSGVTSAPELPATSLTRYCYADMFNGCTSLTTIPEPPATSLAEGCFYSMFENCTSLTDLSSFTLPATRMQISSCRSMFSGCTSLTKSPTICATTLERECFRAMFSRCSNLNTIKINYTGNFYGTGVPIQAFFAWVSGVAATGTFYYDGTDTSTGTNAIPSGWTVQPLTPSITSVRFHQADLDTGIYPTTTMSYVLEVKGTSIGNWFISPKTQDWRLFNAGSDFYFDWYDRISTSEVWDGEGSNPDWWTIEADNYGYTCTSDGGTTFSNSGSSKSSIPNDTLQIGDYQYSWDGQYEDFYLRRLRLYDLNQNNEKVLVADFQPHIDSNNVVCLLEVVGNTLVYPSHGTLTAN